MTAPKRERERDCFTLFFKLSLLDPPRCRSLSLSPSLSIAKHHWNAEQTGTCPYRRSSSRQKHETRWPRRMRSSPSAARNPVLAPPPARPALASPPVFKRRPRPTRPPAPASLAELSTSRLSAARTPEPALWNKNPGSATPPARAVAVCSVAAAAVAAGGAADSTKRRKKRQRTKKSTTSQKSQHPMPPPAPIVPAGVQSAPADKSGAMQVVFVATEVAPWSKVGGLGDVMAALPAALASR